MLIDASRLLECPVLSVQVTAPIARVKFWIVDPATLKILGFNVWGPDIRDDPEVGEILLAKDIREFSPIGMIIDSIEELVNPGDVVKLDKILADRKSTRLNSSHSV